MANARLIQRFLISAGLLAATKVSAEGGTVLSGATLFGGNGGNPITDAVIRIEDGRIQCIGARGRHMNRRRTTRSSMTAS